MVSVSVIIPCYNSAQTIERAIQSVAQQTLRPQEVIVIDDASLDNTIEILQSLQNHYGKDWLKLVILEKNAGPSFARNQGWDLANQDYIAFLDADDAWHPQKIEIQYQWMVANPSVAVSGSEGILPRRSATFTEPERYINYQVKAVPPLAILYSNWLQTSSVMLKRNLSYRFDPQKRYCEDHFLWMQIAVDNYPIYFFDIPLVYLFKSFGVGGLSQQLWKMRLGYLDNCWQLRQARRISLMIFVKLMIAMVFKSLVLVVLGPTTMSRLKNKWLLQQGKSN
jgi:glycosyltransferase involved in cell wall biosynthesis